MCGIAGFYGPYTEANLNAMTAAIAHRGPDGQGIELRAAISESEAVGLGHRRLSIIDLSGGHQPMWTENGRLGIVFNGEIYNYRELRRELEAEGVRFRTNSDTEVILEGWRLRGPRILPALAGMFAFGIWDERDKLWVLARDRAGIKPLYYATPRTGHLIFASEIKPILPFLPQVAPNMGAVYDFLLYSWTPGPETVFEGIKHLPPGHWASWHPGDSAVKPQPFFQRAIGPVSSSFEHAAEELRERFDRAVRSHMIADVPVGINLSGGLDSSAVLASMAQVTDSNAINAFTVGFGLADDETPYAKQMAEHMHVQHHTRTVSKERVAADFSRLVRTIEEPIAHPVLQTTFEAAALARESVKVILIGEGADELFLGYPQYKLLRAPFLYAPAKLIQNYYLAVTCLMPTPRQIGTMLDPAVFDKHLLDKAAHRFDGYFQQRDVVTGAQVFEIENSLVANQLMRIDKLTMAHSLEARVPFLDNDFVDFGMSLPINYKLRGGVTKAVLRQAMTRRLPPTILNRPKTGKGGTQALLPYLNGLVANVPLSNLVSRDTINRRGWLKADPVLGYLAQQNTPFVRHHPIERRRRAKFAYALAVLEQWAREYLD